MAVVGTPECLDFLQFQDVLKRMRSLDDKIVYTLNVNLPTESFRAEKDANKTCKELFQKLEVNYVHREEAIKRCIKFSTEKVQDLKSQREKNMNDINVHKSLRKEQTKLRLLQTELGVEEVVKERTNKVFYERCRSYYTPPNLNL